MREPGPDHPITITLHPKRVRIIVGDTVVAETTRALALREADYPAVLYVPRQDVNWELFARNPRSTHCPYKGDASYYDLTIDGATKAAAVWSYETPFPAVASIQKHLAFYPDKVHAFEESVD